MAGKTAVPGSIYLVENITTDSKRSISTNTFRFTLPFYYIYFGLVYLYLVLKFRSSHVMGLSRTVKVCLIALSFVDPYFLHLA